MSSFLVNLARRGAGLPTTKIQAPPPSPFRPGIRNQEDGLAEEAATDNTVSQTPLPAIYSEEYRELSSEVPIPHAPSIRNLYGTEPSTPIQPFVGEPTTTFKSPLPRSSSVRRLQAISPTRELEAAHVEPPDPAVISKIASEIAGARNLSPPFPVASEIEPTGQPASHASRLPSASETVIQEPSQQQGVALPELPPERPRDEARETRAPALPLATIRPALAESHTLLQFPKVTPASSPTPPSQLPIHVRIGRVEVRGTTAPTPMPARPSPAAPLGFDSYYRVRTYRS